MESFTSSFITRLVGHTDIPTSSLMIAQMGMGEGGLGLTAPDYRAAPDFVFSMVSTAQVVAWYIILSNDLEPVDFYLSILD